MNCYSDCELFFSICVSHSVVIENNNGTLSIMTEIVERFKGHTAGHGAITDDCYDLPVFVACQLKAGS